MNVVAETNTRSLEITPKLGLGDLIFWKMYQISSGIQIKKINVKPYIAHTYRLNGDNYIDFLKQFLSRLFPGVEIQLIDETHNTDVTVEGIKKLYVYDDCKFLKLNVNYEDYIIIHTKCRFDYDSSNFHTIYLKQITDFFGKSQFRYKIMLLGEKDNVEQNLETKTNNIQTIYSTLLESLSKNNEIIDLTRDGLYSDNTIESFEDDISKINNAKLNITFGYGGPLTLSVAFSKNTVGFIGNLNHEVLRKYTEFSEVSLHSRPDTFVKILLDYVI